MFADIAQLLKHSTAHCIREQLYSGVSVANLLSAMAKSQSGEVILHIANSAWCFKRHANAPMHLSASHFKDRLVCLDSSGMYDSLEDAMGLMHDSICDELDLTAAFPISINCHAYNWPDPFYGLFVGGVFNLCFDEIVTIQFEVE